MELHVWNNSFICVEGFYGMCVYASLEIVCGDNINLMC